ncbi:VCBS repeat-containing protein [Crocinitomix catalasitica]|nr:VCBS repeat-containing protein [Crocinitomix catalasitica]
MQMLKQEKLLPENRKGTFVMHPLFRRQRNMPKIRYLNAFEPPPKQAMKLRRFNYLSFLLLAPFFMACSGNGSGEDEETEKEDQMFFETLSADQTGISFSNNITEVDTFNYMTFQNIYNGGGVAIGDINNDGLSDIYFTGNQVSDKLYLNQGNMKFKDITEKAIGPLASDGWHTGVTMADVNQDGFIDIYVSRGGPDYFFDLRSNFLFINNGDNTFSEKSEEYGVNAARGTVQSAFFDMDNDGDLDLYVMNQPYQEELQRVTVDLATFPFSDQLFENVDGHYEDISQKAGIQNGAFGLGISISDLNNDGYQDIYTSSDYLQPDYMYINNGDGTFSEEGRDRTAHMSQFGMGTDIADFNNDGHMDIIVVDMVSEDHIRSKKNMGGMSTEVFWESVDYGNHYQYMFNTLQLNNGNGTFSEIAQMAGISKTDWSWAPLFADFDNDGLLDLYITNGYRRDMRDNDYAPIFGEGVQNPENYKEILDKAPSTKVSNYMYRNQGNLRFKNVSKSWKIDEPVNSNGAAYADLDNDGDLDLVVNNIDDVSYIMENKLQSENRFLRIKCDKNFEGAKARVTIGDKQYYQEIHASRGFISSVESAFHFGVGTNDIIDELQIVFLDSSVITRKNVAANQLLQLKYADAKKSKIKSKNFKPFFAEVTSLNHRHQEIFRNDFSREILLPHKLSQLGPFLSAGDVNGDGLEDFYVSGSTSFSGSLYIQAENERFIEKSGPWKNQKGREELGSLLFDADNDGDLDLYVVSGSNEINMFSPLMRDQLYINDGRGNFKNETNNRLPPMYTSGQQITSADFDKDGDIDLFVPGRQVPVMYPLAPKSHLLRNDNGKFTEITLVSGDLMSPGLITDAIFDDFDQDGDLDLIAVGEWMPISFYENTNGRFLNVTQKYKTDGDVGWWMSIEKGDFNGDGKNDYVVGNIGENNKFHPGKNKPLEIYVEDFDQNGVQDIVLGKYQNGHCYPVRGRQCSSEQMPFIKDKFPTFDEFAVADLDKIYGPDKLKNAMHFSATNFSSSILLSTPDGFTLQRLPPTAQMGPLNGIEIFDVDMDGNLDIVAVGNNFGAEVETIRYDGGRGTVLLGNGFGGFTELSINESGFFVWYDAKDIIRIKNLIIVSSNNAPLKIFRWLKFEEPT